MKKGEKRRDKEREREESKRDGGIRREEGRKIWREGRRARGRKRGTECKDRGSGRK